MKVLRRLTVIGCRLQIHRLRPGKRQSGNISGLPLLVVRPLIIECEARDGGRRRARSHDASPLAIFIFV